jgi:hypothetical protein
VDRINVICTDVVPGSGIPKVKNNVSGKMEAARSGMTRIIWVVSKRVAKPLTTVSNFDRFKK